MQTVSHTHQYTIKVEINNPSANALIIGNDNRVNVTNTKIDRRQLVDDIKVGNMDTKYIRKNMDEIISLSKEIVRLSS